MCPPGFAPPACTLPATPGTGVAQRKLYEHKARFYFSASVLHRNFFASVPSPFSPGNQGDAVSPAQIPQWHKFQVPPTAVTASVVPAGQDFWLPGGSTACSHPPGTDTSTQKGAVPSLPSATGSLVLPNGCSKVLLGCSRLLPGPPVQHTFQYKGKLKIGHSAFRKLTQRKMH